MLDDQGKPVPRLRGMAFWAILISGLPIPVMWSMGYKGVFFPLWTLLYLTVVALFRWKTTTYTSRFGIVNKDDELRDEKEKKLSSCQEQPWIIVCTVPFGLSVHAMGYIVKDASVSTATLYLWNSVFFFFVGYCIFESVRRFRM